jgi:hypothetical protein
MTSKLIIFIGPIGSGKDFRANEFLSDAKAFGYSMEKVCFADELRECMWDLWGWRPKDDKDYEKFKCGTVSMYCGNFESSLFEVSGRGLLQRLGTDVIRKRMPDFWVECWKRKVSNLLNNGKNVVCSDLRFPNELKTALTIETDKNTDPIDREFLFCNYRSARYSLDEHESEVLAQKILEDGYNDGDSLEFDYLWSIIPEVERRIEEIQRKKKEYKNGK